MKTIFFVFVAVLVVSCKNNDQLSLADQQISESEYLVAATNWYQKSAEMRACYYQAYKLAKMQLLANKNAYTGKKPTAVVLDIDETVLDNSPFQAHLIRTGQLYNNDLWNEWVNRKEAKALPGAVDFVTYAKSIGVEVFYISNRYINSMEPTLANLQSCKFVNADTNFVLLKSGTSNKTKRREKVLEKYDVLLYVGDNLGDFSEIFNDRSDNFGFAQVDNSKELFGDKYIVLPNPMYGSWEKVIFKGDYSISAVEKRKLRHEVLDGY